MDSRPILAGVIGWPVKHSLSPVIHTAAATAAGIDLEYSAIAVEPGSVDAALQAMRDEHIRGYSVTMPHKEAVISGLDELTVSATALGAVNHITNTNGHLVGNNTDGDGFILGFEHGSSRTIRGSTVGVIGSGGAARAIVEACARHGADGVVVVARSAERAHIAASLAKDVGSVGTEDSLRSCDVVVNATPVGMAETPGEGELVTDVSNFDDHTVVVDIVYNPRETPLLAAARERGLETVEGVTMLVGQAAEQFSTWTGVAAPLEAMFGAIKSLNS